MLSLTLEETIRIKDILSKKTDLSNEPELFEKLIDYYSDEIPYGTLKARTGDPYKWIFDKLDQEYSQF